MLTVAIKTLMLSAVMLNVVMLNVVMLNVVMLTVEEPSMDLLAVRVWYGTGLEWTI
jgi:hypothetical protein